MTSKTIHNTGFLYCCGHRADVGGVPTKLHIELRARGLATDTPDLDQPIETICPSCWLKVDDGKLLVLRTQVLRTVLKKEQSHSLLVLLHHLAVRIIADKTRGVHLNILTQWAKSLARSYSKTHLDDFIDAMKERAIGAKIHPLVVSDAILSIEASANSDSEFPVHWNPDGALGDYRKAVERFYKRVQWLRWSIRKPWPALVGSLLTTIASTGVRYAALFIPDNKRIRAAEWNEDAARFLPKGHSALVEYEKLADTTHKFKVECYSLFHDATNHPMAVTRRELDAVIKSVQYLDWLRDRTISPYTKTIDHYRDWCDHGTREQSKI
ncbi:hypothetical protein PGQ11_002594 [Apiospora arundinis]|uniref:Uncharacterized protein n=1 Tax=Apiospora arundinis TaxID=335852 RepID=A0ABR2JIM1_9PEZI